MKKIRSCSKRAHFTLLYLYLVASGICLSIFPPCTTSLPGRRFGTSTKAHSLDYLPLPCPMLKPSGCQDYLHYLEEEKKSSWNSSSRSLQIRNTNCIHFCQKWTYLLTALGTKDYINDQDVGLNVARTVLF